MGTGHMGLLSQGRWQPRPEKGRGQAPGCCQRQREEASSQERETAEPRGSRGQRDERSGRGLSWSGLRDEGRAWWGRRAWGRQAAVLMSGLRETPPPACRRPCSTPMRPDPTRLSRSPSRHQAAAPCGRDAARLPHTTPSCGAVPMVLRRLTCAFSTFILSSSAFRLDTEAGREGGNVSLAEVFLIHTPFSHKLDLKESSRKPRADQGPPPSSAPAPPAAQSSSAGRGHMESASCARSNSGPCSPAGLCQEQQLHSLNRGFSSPN